MARCDNQLCNGGIRDRSWAEKDLRQSAWRGHVERRRRSCLQLLLAKYFLTSCCLGVRWGAGGGDDTLGESTKQLVVNEPALEPKILQSRESRSKESLEFSGSFKSGSLHLFISTQV